MIRHLRSLTETAHPERIPSRVIRKLRRRKLLEPRADGFLYVTDLGWSVLGH